ncbi:MAG TPA: hypothetical protein VOA87_16370, partial [Thermoanaerobaculia bacterium]|nr:hypothetical protein [Thermoanaerobaculia bacterium]
MKALLRFLPAALALLFAATAAHTGQALPGPGLASLPEAYPAVREFREAAISPDGAQVAWVEALPEGGSAIYLAAVGSPGARRRVTDDV